MQDTIYISGLEPLIAPEEVAFWPPAPGWYVVVGILLLAVLLFLLGWIRKRRENHYRVLALNRLKGINERVGTSVVQGDILALNRLLKETALSIYPREQVAPLYGFTWLEFLDQHCSKTDFSNQFAGLLDTGTYISKDQLSVPIDQWNLLISNVEIWIRNHKL